MVTLPLYFDILVIIILLTMMMIGYITGATVELIKLIKIYVPFIVVFYLGGPISRFVFKSDVFNSLINKATFLKGMPYFNTLVMFLSTFIAFFGTYFIIGIIIKFIQNRLQSEIVSYKLGKFNNSVGAIIAIVRFYIIISILILPFFMLGFTTTKDISTSLVLEYPPPYTQIGRLVNSSQPALNASNSLSGFMSVIDVNQLKKSYEVVTNLETKLNEYENQVLNACNYTTTTTKYPHLYAYVNNPDACSNASLDDVLEYKGFIIWISEDNIDLQNLTQDEEQLINSFNTNYEKIYNNTSDLSMQSKLKTAHTSSQIYLVVNNWLKEVLDENYVVSDLLNDDNMQIIIAQLIDDRANQQTEGLFHDLKTLEIENMDQKLEAISTFLTNYTETYEKTMRNMPDSLPFKYKLIASTIKDFDFIPPLERTPLMAMYVIDSFSLLEGNLQLMDGEPLYRSLVKIAIPLYLIKQDESGESITFTASDMEAFLTKNCSNKICSIDDAFDKVIITDDFFIELMFALTDTENGTIDSYLEELITIKQGETKPLMDPGVVQVLKDYMQANYPNSKDSRVEKIMASLNGVGDVNG